MGLVYFCLYSVSVPESECHVLILAYTILLSYPKHSVNLAGNFDPEQLLAYIVLWAYIRS